MLRASLIALLTFSATGSVGLCVYGLFHPGVSSMRAASGVQPPFDYWRKGTNVYIIAVTLRGGRPTTSALPQFDLLGLRYGRFVPLGWQRAYHALTIPLWIPAVLFGVPPLISLFRGPVRRWRRRRHGLCVRCGYQLAGLIEPRCPECGTEFGSSSFSGRAGSRCDHHRP